jgi:hypothetical protein
MSIQPRKASVDPEIDAIRIVHETLNGLNQEAQIRVIQYVASKLGIGRDRVLPSGSDQLGESGPTGGQAGTESSLASSSAAAPAERFDAINPVAEKWVSRNGLEVEKLQPIFSLGGEEIDLVADSIPGKSKRQRMLNVVLLKAVAAYLGTGAARVPHQQIKETCMHYDAYDAPNFAKYLKEFTSEVSGTKEAGYTLSPRGLSDATKLLKQMTQAGRQ